MPKIKPNGASAPVDEAVLPTNGIVIFVRLIQPLNAESPILVTLFGISMLVSPLHPLNATAPILVTLFGISMLFK